MHYTAAVLAFALATPLAAQTPPAPPVTEEPQTDDIVVTAPRLSGSVETDLPPVLELDTTAIESYGASSVTDLLTALGAQTGGGRGRGGDRPIVLINGRRVSGFSEIRDLPPEAIERVQIMPEEVALQFGASPDQRVVNFILKTRFAAITGELEQGLSLEGGRRETKLETSLVRIDRSNRLSLSANYTDNAAVLEDAREITPRSTAARDDPAFRTLLPAARTLQLNGTLARPLTADVNLTLNASADFADTDALGGRAALLLPSGLALDRATRSATLHGGLTLDGNLDRWRWTLTGNLDRATVRTRTDVDRLADPTDTARSVSDSSDAIYTLAGPLFELPAGPVRTTVRAGFVTRRLAGTTVRGGLSSDTRVARDEANGRLNLSVPLASRREGIAEAVGDLSINGNLGYRRVSDFGGLTSYGYGLNWTPTPGLSIQASSINEDSEPSIQDIGNPVIVTPNVNAFDFVRGETVTISRTSGGNPGLVTEQRRDVRLGATYQPPGLSELTLSANYFRNRSTNPVAGFPTLTPEIERAFPDRVVRDNAGRLLAIDGRSVNFASTSSDVLRVGFIYAKQFGRPAGRGGGGRGGGGRGGRGRSAVDVVAQVESGEPGAPAGGGGRFGGGGRGGRGGGGEGGRWSVSLYDSIRFTDRIVVRPDLPVLDLLGGSATGGSGGAPRHSVDLEGGWFNRGLGVRVTGSYVSGSDVLGSAGGGVGGSDLFFGDLFTLNATAFVNFDQRRRLIEQVPFLKGSRLRLSLSNLTGSVRDVRDGAGLVPLGYQAGYLDPRGRFVELSFRKRF